jgi:hypothetical protein
MSLSIRRSTTRWENHEPRTCFGALWELTNISSPHYSPGLIDEAVELKESKVELQRPQ